MTTAKAIVSLRKKLQYTQVEFAKRLRVKPITISRYENGREPKSEIMKRLADLAESVGAAHLRAFFEAAWKGGVVSKIDNLPSAGAERRVPKDWIELWAYQQERIFRGCTGLLKKGALLPAEKRSEVIEGIRREAERTWRDLQTFLKESKSELDPNENFDQITLYASLQPDWMDSLYGTPVPIGPLGRRGVRAKEPTS